MTIPILFLKKLIIDQCSTKALANEIVLRMPQRIDMKVLAAIKEINNEVWNEQSVLKERLDGLEDLVQN